MRDNKRRTRLECEQLEDRYLLSSVFPAYINGNLTFGDATQDAPYGLDNTFLLESNPGAEKTILLDFDGHHSRNNWWNHDIVFPSFDRDGDSSTFSDSELIEIQKQFQNVAEDFLPFDVNVTTLDPGVEALRKSNNADTEYGVRAINTQYTDGFGNGTGGIAYLNSFSASSDTPVFTFNKGARNGGMTNSHEVGHALNLRHDGLGSSTYHPGTGSGDTSWGPILGAPFGKRVTQWSNGDYANSTNTEDDLAIITNNTNGFGYKADDHGDDTGAATELTVTNVTEVSGWGVVDRNFDLDYFSFTTGTGNVTLDINAFGDDPNLDILATLYDANGTEIANSNPTESTDADFDLDLDEGEYFVSIDGVGKSGVYSDYGSMGFYTINGEIAPPATEVTIGESGTVSINNGWTTVNLNETYDSPVVIVGPATFAETDPTTIRVRNVTSGSFQFKVEDWKYLPNRRHAFEEVSYLVVEAGEHILDDGTRLVAGTTEMRTRWTNVDFGTTFDSTPVVLSSANTRNGGEPITTRQRNITTTGFDAKLQEEEASGPHTDETVGWIAIDQVVSTNGETQYEAIRTDDSFTHRQKDIDFTDPFASTPVILAGMQTTDGGDPATTRLTAKDTDSITVFIEEEQSKNDETNHTTEVVGVLAMDGGPLIINNSAGAPTANERVVPLTTFLPTDGTFGEPEANPFDCGCDDHEHETHGHGQNLEDDVVCHCSDCQQAISSAVSSVIPFIADNDSVESESQAIEFTLGDDDTHQIENATVEDDSFNQQSDTKTDRLIELDDIYQGSDEPSLIGTEFTRI